MKSRELAPPITSVKSGHTPGPWSGGYSEWSVDNNGENTCASILADNREDPVCIVVEGAAYGRDRQLDANARLISAAPDLLAALKALFESYKQLADSGDAGFWKLENTLEGKQAIAALAKAEGQP